MALRSTAQVISYEIAMGLSLVAVFLYTGSMSTSQIVDGAEEPLVHRSRRSSPSPSTSSRWSARPTGCPFDLAEGEGELTGGFHTEYSSLKFAMFFLGEYVNMFTVSALATTMFLGGWQAPAGIAAINDGMFNHGWWGLLWFVIKLWLFMFFFVWLRGSLPRVRYDQFMRFGWKFLIPVTLLWVVAVAFIRGAQLLASATARPSPAIPCIVSRRRHRRARPRGWPGSGTAGATAREWPAADGALEEIDPFAGGYPVPAAARPAPARARPR